MTKPRSALQAVPERLTSTAVESSAAESFRTAADQMPQTTAASTPKLCRPFHTARTLTAGHLDPKAAAAHIFTSRIDIKARAVAISAWF